MPYYHDLITQRSWQALKDFKKDYDFILIGGWAVWLYARSLKSKDIDLVIEFDQLEKLKRNHSLFKNERLKKYQFKIDEINFDIYVPFYSQLGIPVEKIQEKCQTIETFKVPSKEILLILKQKAYENRKLSVKGQKDLIDIFSLLNLPDFDWQVYFKNLAQYKLRKFQAGLQTIIEQTPEIRELNLNRHQFSRLKKKWLAKF